MGLPGQRQGARRAGPMPVRDAPAPRAVGWTAVLAGLLVAGPLLMGPSRETGVPSPESVASSGGPRRQAPAPRAPEIASYRIDVELDPETTLLRGSEALTWTNPSTVAVDELWFHMYQNAFRNEESSRMIERGGFPPGDGPLQERIGYIELHALRLADGTDLLPDIRWRHPDDGVTTDRTLFSVPLPEPVPPGGSVEVEAEFTTRLSRGMGARAGVRGDYWLVAQWYPKLAVFEPAGRRGRREPGWNAHQFHADGEFYADFGRYQVHITVPESYVVGATGRRTATLETEEPGRVRYTYEQEDVHDFAWTAWPGFREVVRTFDPAAEVTAAERREVAGLLGVGASELQLRPVDVTLLIPPAFAHHVERHMRATMEALKWFGLWYGAYPYDTVTVVVPADGTTGGGMEYPTFFTTSDLYPLRYPPLRDVLGPEQVTVHEFGHQYWYGIVASNQTEEAWLDEGFDSYSTAKVLTRAYGSAMGTFLGIELGADALARGAHGAGPRTGRVVQDSWTYLEGSYGTNSYQRPELVLRTLERSLGEATFARAMRTWYQRWKFRHPTSRDFFDVVEEACDCDLGSFWEQAVLGDAVADFAVRSVASRRLESPRGRFREDGETVFRAEGEPLEPARYRNRAVIQRVGDLRWPVQVLLTFADGSEHRETWDGEGRLHEVVVEGPSPLVSATVDPEHLLALDIDRINNSRTVESLDPPRRRWTLRWLGWMSNLIFTFTGLF